MFNIIYYECETYVTFFFIKTLTKQKFVVEFRPDFARTHSCTKIRSDTSSLLRRTKTVIAQMNIKMARMSQNFPDYITHFVIDSS